MMNRGPVWVGMTLLHCNGVLRFALKPSVSIPVVDSL